ncbi:hypothetical protein AQJ27_35740 [Streptomyces olivochromogenes]|uniref:Uncharacterized protein n=1 Tax=Streptomyces olivochromogenes TaxID=1963 RepID=A0A250VQV4_STROL|nr:hypothetical protein AQJ27_35740 [Streptomyces olivochromogenes]GAX56577.1 hypothetical protein SO3561_08145 [Streptomyces olivochromogenes]
MIHMTGRYPTASPGPERGTLVDAMLERQGRNVRFWQRMRERTDTVETAVQQMGLHPGSWTLETWILRI